MHLAIFRAIYPGNLDLLKLPPLLSRETSSKNNTKRWIEFTKTTTEISKISPVPEAIFSPDSPLVFKTTVKDL
jgi:hypothetical protein